MILLHASIGDSWREVGDGIVEGLHLDQKTVLVERDASCVGSELSQDLGVRGVGKLVPVHLDGKFLEIVPSFEHGSPGGPATKLKDAVHVTMTSPLAMVEGIERIQSMQHVGLQ